MPSKTKKHSKTPSRLSNSDPPASPRMPFSTPKLDSRISEEDFRSTLEEASSRYPSVIGKSAFIGQVTDVEAESRGCKIWLSESSMVASSLAPGSIVSVSFPASPEVFSDGFPLSSLADECAQQFGIDALNRTTDGLGTYFALATVFPSSKVLKNGVRLSSSLYYTLGCPSSGRILFVHVIQSQFVTGQVTGTSKPHNGEANNLSLSTCKELHLELVPHKNEVKLKGNRFCATDVSSGKSNDQHGNGTLGSPKTPFYQPKLHSQNANQLASPVFKDLVSNSLDSDRSCVDSFDMEEVLKDESAKQLLQNCASSWLFSRCLLSGNLVDIPLPTDHCIFLVVGARILSMDTTNKDLITERSLGLCPQAPGFENECDAFVINNETKVYLHSPLDSISKSLKKGDVSCLQQQSKDVKAKTEHDGLKLGGLSKEYASLKDIVISSSVKDTLSSLGLRPTKGVLLHGPPGTGKTSLAQLCVHDAGVNLFAVNGPEIVSQNYGESEQALHAVFDSASHAAPAVVFIDELDAIAPARKDGGEELSQRMVATLLNLMDGISRTDGLLVVAATNRPESIDPALRRPGRLDKEIEIGVPSPVQRLEILRTLLSDMDHSLIDSQIQQLSMTTHGFVGADLAALCNEAALVCLRRYAKFEKSSNGFHSDGNLTAYEGNSGTIVEESECSANTEHGSKEFLDSASSNFPNLPNSSSGIPSPVNLRGTVSKTADTLVNGVCNGFNAMLTVGEVCTLKVTFEDFERARMKVRPSAMREVILEVPKVNWEDVGGLREVKTQLMEAVEWPQKHREAFRRIGTRPPTGILMFGPPGCSKTLLARAVASEAGLNFLAVKGPELFSKWVGESEKAVRSVFSKARANAPSIIFFDEIDGLAVVRGKESNGVSVSDRVMSQLLVELDGLHERVNVTVIAATNRPDKIDSALLRPGRFDRLLYVGPPSEADREEIFHIHLHKIPCSPDVSVKELACLTKGCTGADISLICREAALSAIEENLDASEIRMQHLKNALRQVQPSDIQSYEELSAKFQRLVHSNDREDLSRNHQRSSKASWFPIWTLIKSAALFFCRLPAAISQPKSGPCSENTEDHSKLAVNLQTL